MSIILPKIIWLCGKKSDTLVGWIYRNRQDLISIRPIGSSPVNSNNLPNNVKDKVNKPRDNSLRLTFKNLMVSFIVFVIEIITEIK
jgi:hypothetical protein